MINNGQVMRVLLCAMLWIPLSGCAATVGQQFREIMAEIDAKCRSEKMGPYLDPNDPGYIRKRRYSDCDILKIKPADPLATEEGRFAYAIKLPPPHDTLKASYRPGMNAETYFKELCEKDAGEWIFKTVEGVEGVFQGRRMAPFSGGYSSLVFHTRELSEFRNDEPELALVQPNSGRYNFFEISSSSEKRQPGRYTRFYRGDVNTSKYGGSFQTSKNGLMVRVPYILHEQQTDRLNSRYGFTWRQLLTADFLENAIVGGETIIYDRTTNEVLAFRRFFSRVWPNTNSRYTRLTNSDYCQPGFSGTPFQFIQNVLVPINSAQ